MSVAIGITLPDGALVVTDSRVVRGSGDVQTVASHEVRKVEDVGPLVVSARFGIEDLAAGVIAGLRKELPGLLTPQAIAERQENLMDEAETYFRTYEGLLDPDELAIGVLTAGARNGVSFLVGSVHWAHHDNETAFVEGQGGVWIVGSPNDRVRDDFNAAVRKVWETFAWDCQIGPMNRVIHSLIGVAYTTIRETENLRPVSGGTVTPVVIRQGFGVARIYCEEEAKPC